MSIYIYNSEQLKKIRDACQITANILDDLEEIIEEGITTFELDQFTRKRVEDYKVKAAFLGYGGFPGTICASLNDVVVHGIPDKNTRLKNGDILSVDFGVNKDGFFGDSARTFKIGNTSTEVNDLINSTRASLYKGIEAARVDNRISDIGAAVQKYIDQSGYGIVRDYVGHGIGQNLHEDPAIPNFGKPGKGPRIKNGMVFAIEPMINLGDYKVKLLEDGWTVKTCDNSVSVHFEHTVAVIDGKAEILTKGKKFN